MEEQSEIVRSKKEFAFASSTILSQVGRGIIVGLIVGIIVGSFRFLIEKGFHMIQGVYQDQGYLVRNLFVLVLFYILICWLSAKLTRSEKDIKGSGIPQVEAELKGLMSLNWWGILWKKYVLGILAIASGLMLGREGPSIQLGAVGGKGIAKWLKSSPVEERSLIASGAAAGLAAAFNAPIAALLFVVEEVYHHFSRFFWVSTLAASIVANFVSLLMFGLTPVLDMPDNIPPMTLDQYWIYLVMGIFLGFSGFLYEKAVLNVGRVYDLIGQKIHLDRAYYPILAFILIIFLILSWICSKVRQSMKPCWKKCFQKKYLAKEKLHLSKYQFLIKLLGNKFMNSTYHTTSSSQLKSIMARAKQLTAQPECIWVI